MPIPYTLTRSRRKTICLRITKDLRVEVRAPLRMSQGSIDAFVSGHEAWIRQNLERLAGETAEKRRFRFADGDTLLYRGREVVLARSGDRTVRADAGWLFAPVEGRQEAVREFLREETRKLVTEGVARYAPALGVLPAGIKVTLATTRWGSCSGKNRLCFSYRLACLPGALVDYVVVHELCHILQHNHSDRFWALVAGVLPDYPERRKLLRLAEKRMVV